jgi:hypothetical protein
MLDDFNRMAKDPSILNLKYDGAHLWPLLTNFIFREFFNEEKAKTEKKAKKTHAVFSIAKFLIQIFRSYKLNSKVWFFGAHSHRIKNNGLLINRYFDPLMDEMELEGHKSVLFEYGQEIPSKEIYKSERVFSISALSYLVNFINKYCSSFFPKDTNGLKESEAIIADYLQKHGGKYVSGNFSKYVYKVYVWRMIFKWLFKISKPQRVSILCYYSTSMYGLCWACNEMDVWCADLQHGVQGDMLVNYSIFSNSPEMGFLLLPRIFWVWDEQSAESLNNWIKNQKRHEIFVGGNPWRQYQFKVQDPIDVKKDKPFLLYSMQVQEPLIENFLLVAIKESYTKYYWWLRAHPRMTAAQVSQIELLLKEHGLEKDVFFEKANYLPLNLLMAHVDLHLSKYSAVVLEASEEGVFSILLDRMGEQIFTNLIQTGIVESLQEYSSGPLLRLIESKINVKSHKKDVVDSFFLFKEKLQSAKGSL